MPNGLTPADDDRPSNPELRHVGIASAFAFAAAERGRYASFFEADGSLGAPASARPRRRDLPEHLRTAMGIVVTAGQPEPVTTPG